MKRIISTILILTFLITSLACCNKPEDDMDRTSEEIDASSETIYDPDAPKAGDPVFPEEGEEVAEDLQEGEINIDNAEVPLSSGVLLLPQASGRSQVRNDKATIDYSNVSDGYVMVAYNQRVSIRIKSQVTCPDGIVYTYDLQPGYWTAFPLAHGNGKYKVTVFENTGGNKYATVLSTSFDVALSNEFAPFIRPNQYINYASASATISAAEQITANCSTALEEVNAVYDWVVDNISYDRNQAATVQSGYLPVLDSVLSKKTGICFDYAALMCGMLRSQMIPCKLIVGYAGSAYHAWISVYTAETGWIDNTIYFDGSSWHRMDPTFASTGNNDQQVIQYIGDGRNYLEKFSY